VPGKTAADSFTFFLGIDSPTEAAWREDNLLLSPHPTLARYNLRYNRALFVGALRDELHLWDVTDGGARIIYTAALCVPGLSDVQLFPQGGNGLRLLFETPCRGQRNEFGNSRQDQPSCMGSCMAQRNCTTYPCLEDCMRNGPKRRPMWYPSEERPTQPLLDKNLFMSPFAKLTAMASSPDPGIWGDVRQTLSAAWGPIAGGRSYAAPIKGGMIFARQESDGAMPLKLRMGLRIESVLKFGMDFAPIRDEMTIDTPGPLNKVQFLAVQPNGYGDVIALTQVAPGTTEPCPANCPEACVCPVPGIHLSRLLSSDLAPD